MGQKEFDLTKAKYFKSGAATKGILIVLLESNLEN
jgi:hypothetical protein